MLQEFDLSTLPGQTDLIFIFQDNPPTEIQLPTGIYGVMNPCDQDKRVKGSVSELTAEDRETILPEGIGQEPEQPPKPTVPIAAGPELP